MKREVPGLTPIRFLDTGHHDYPRQAFQILLDGEADKVLHPERSLLVKGEDLVKVVGWNYPPKPQDAIVTTRIIPSLVGNPASWVRGRPKC